MDYGYLRDSVIHVCFTERVPLESWKRQRGNITNRCDYLGEMFSKVYCSSLPRTQQHNLATHDCYVGRWMQLLLFDHGGGAALIVLVAMTIAVNTESIRALTSTPSAQRQSFDLLTAVWTGGCDYLALPSLKTDLTHCVP